MKSIQYFSLAILLILLACNEEEVNDLSPKDYPETVTATIQHQNNTRHYTLHIPKSFDGTTAYPMVVFLHGGSGNMVSAQGFTQFNQVSKDADFLMLYPQGLHKTSTTGFSWADGRNGAADDAGIDDVGYINQLVDEISKQYNVNTNKIYLCGFSNGSFMTQRMAFESNGKFAAMGTLGGTLHSSYFDTGAPGRAIPMIYFFGTDDAYVPYAGGEVAGSGTMHVVGIEAAVEYWKTNNNCKTSAEAVNLPDIDNTDNSTATLYEYSDCDCNNAQVKFYKLNGAGHTWAGVELTAQEPVLGETNEDVFASQELWNFFNQFELCK